MKIAVIPARGGSKRIPQKNIKNFLGKPIIAHSIETAKVSGLFDRIIVSTDNHEIAAVARDFGAEVPFMRPAELADDYTGTNAVVKHSIEWLNINGFQIDFVCCIYATAPFLNISYLKQGIERLEKTNKLYAFSVTSFPSTIFRSFRMDNDDSVKMFWPEYLNTRSQDLPVAYHDAGQFYWGKPEAFLKNYPVFSNHSIGIVLPQHLVMDIDTIEEWKQAELMYKALQIEEQQCTA
ncbi:MAG: pseudaminic acid cytidylyltransferase [Desulfobacteraceae bacterium]|jgi:pseudaminic acid cytidylyltransferase|nr:pseudaminic acid cytidylyltransferase [Desulfobacteraceae bacterium]